MKFFVRLFVIYYKYLVYIFFFFNSRYQIIEKMLKFVVLYLYYVYI